MPTVKQNSKLKLKSRSRYDKELILEGFGVVYASSKSKLSDTETLVRIRFKPRKWIGGFGWDTDRRMIHCYASRRQPHKRFRFGWEYNAFWSTNGPLESLGNLRRRR